MQKKEDLRVRKTKKNLYEGLMSIMRNKAFEEIKVSDICNVSLTNRSTFYDHFNDKYELLASLIKDLEKELAEKLEENKNIETAKDYYLKMIELLFDHISENINIYSSIIKHNNNSIASDMFRGTLQKDVEKFLATKLPSEISTPIEVITTFYVSAIIEVCLLYLKEPNKYKKEDILSYINNLLPSKIY